MIGTTCFIDNPAQCSIMTDSPVHHQSSDSRRSNNLGSPESYQATRKSNGEHLVTCHEYPKQISGKSQPLELKPHRIVIDRRRKEATIQFRATVTDEQLFHLPLPHSELTKALKTLYVHDDRVRQNEYPPASYRPGDSSYKICGARCTPTFHFPSPSKEKITGPYRNAVWYNLLQANIGNYIHLNTLHGPRAGRISGVDVDENLATIILDEGGWTGVHAFEPSYPTPTTIYAPPSTVPNIVPNAVPRTTVPVLVQTYGQGEGTLTVSYSVPTKDTNGFEFFYRLFVPTTMNRDMAESKATLHCSARVTNPFDFDLDDVQLCLVVSGERNYDSEDKDASTSAQAASSSSSSSSSRVSSPSSRTVSSNPEDGEDVLSIDQLSIDSFSNTSLCAVRFHDRAVYEASQPVTIGVGQSTEVWLFDAAVTVQICHYFAFWRSNIVRLERILKMVNTSQVILESGTIDMYFADMETRNDFMYPLSLGQDLVISWAIQTPASLILEEKIRRMDNGTSCIVRDGRLIIRMLLDRTIRFIVHNKQLHQATICIDFPSAIHRGETKTTKVVRYPTREDEILDQNQQPVQCHRQSSWDRWWEINCKLEGEEKTFIVVREQYSREKVIDLVDACSPRQVAKLKAAAAISQPFAEKLRLINGIRRKIDRILREQKHLSATRRQLRSLADAKASNYGENNDQGNQQTAPTQSSMEEHFASLDNLENDIALILERSEELALKLVDVEIEAKKISEDLEIEHRKFVDI